MSIPVYTKVRVLSKFSSERTNSNNQQVIYYNLKVADVSTYENQIIGVTKEIYDFAEEGQDIRLLGKVGGLKEKYWYFNDYLEKDK